jgi:hypothetical protein
MGAGLEAVKARMKEIAEKRKNNEASNVEIDLYTTLEIVNEMWERGFKFGKLDLYRSQATEFLIDGDTLIPPFVAMERTLPSKSCGRVKKENSSLRPSSGSAAVFRLPWLKRWMRWAFLAICQRITS